MRYELSDHEWGIIAPMLPNKPRGDAWWQAVRSGQISAGYLQVVVAHEEGHLIC